MGQHKKQRRRITDFVLYIVVGVGVAALAVILGIETAKRGTEPEASLKWTGLAFMTLLVFWWTIRRHRNLWRSAKFWRRIAFLAAVHVIVGIAILRRVARVPLLPLFLVAPVEYFFLDVIVRGGFEDSR